MVQDLPHHVAFISWYTLTHSQSWLQLDWECETVCTRVSDVNVCLPAAKNRPLVVQSLWNHVKKSVVKSIVETELQPTAYQCHG